MSCCHWANGNPSFVVQGAIPDFLFRSSTVHFIQSAIERKRITEKMGLEQNCTLPKTAESMDHILIQNGQPNIGLQAALENTNVINQQHNPMHLFYSGMFVSALELDALINVPFLMRAQL